METVKKFSELMANLDTLQLYLNKKTDPEYSFALDLIKKGTCFVVLKENQRQIFCPSRFAGYVNNNMNEHMNNLERDGRVTNQAIFEILKCEPIRDIELDKLYRKYCDSLGFQANDKGTFGVERKYWEVQ